MLAKGGNSNRGKDLASRRETERNNKRKLRQQKGEDKASKKGTGRNTKKMKKEDRKTRKQQQKKDKKKNQRRNKENSRENRGPERQNKEHKGKNGVEKEKTKEGIKKNKAMPTKAKGQEKEPQAINIQRSGMKVTSKDADGEKRLCKKTPQKMQKPGRQMRQGRNVYDSDPQEQMPRLLVRVLSYCRYLDGVCYDACRLRMNERISSYCCKWHVSKLHFRQNNLFLYFK